ncbi:hypothetical protein YPPY13_1647, partial [Yersinia pestis PY-13]
MATPALSATRYGGQQPV